MWGDLVLELAFENTAIQLQVGFISKIEFKVIQHACSEINTNTMQNI